MGSQSLIRLSFLKRLVFPDLERGYMILKTAVE